MTAASVLLVLGSLLLQLAARAAVLAGTTADAVPIAIAALSSAVAHPRIALIVLVVALASGVPLAAARARLRPHAGGAAAGFAGSEPGVLPAAVGLLAPTLGLRVLRRGLSPRLAAVAVVLAARRVVDAAPALTLTLILAPGSGPIRLVAVALATAELSRLAALATGPALSAPLPATSAARGARPVPSSRSTLVGVAPEAVQLPVQPAAIVVAAAALASSAALALAAAALVAADAAEQALAPVVALLAAAARSALLVAVSILLLVLVLAAGAAPVVVLAPGAPLLSVLLPWLAVPLLAAAGFAAARLPVVAAVHPLVVTAAAGQPAAVLVGLLPTGSPSTVLLSPGLLTAVALAARLPVATLLTTASLTAGALLASLLPAAAIRPAPGAASLVPAALLRGPALSSAALVRSLGAVFAVLAVAARLPAALGSVASLFSVSIVVVSVRHRCEFRGELERRYASLSIVTVEMVLSAGRHARVARSIR